MTSSCHSFFVYVPVIEKSVFFNITWYLKRIWQNEVPSLHHLHYALGVQSWSKTFWFMPISEAVPTDDQKAYSDPYKIVNITVRETN